MRTAGSHSGSEGFPWGPKAAAWLGDVLRCDPQRLCATPMSGSTSSSLFRIECPRGSRVDRYVLRLIDNGPWLAEEPDVAEHEYAALQEAKRAGLKAPEPVACAGLEAGFGFPVVLMGFVEGKVRIRAGDFQAWLEKIAFELAAVHAHSPARFPWRYRSWTPKEDLAPPAWSAEPELWEVAVERLLEGEPDAPARFLHRDYHPVNLLWVGGEIHAVVDWIQACLGPAGVDVAHCRTNLALMHGPWAAELFLAAYTRFAPDFAYDPYWDYDSILDWSLQGPSFYSPWAEFGLARVPPRVLRDRLEGHLRRVVRSSS